MRDIIKYKDFIGSVHFAAEDEVFYGKIEGIDDLVTFEANNVKDLKEAFELMVDEHIKDSEKEGIPLKKSYKGSLNIRIPGNLHEKASELAIVNGISLNQFIQQAIQHEISFRR
ncbi:MAG: type II toxin-antitoxin system HicB family antitoxin [Chlorobi bacterium]|nr:type II toxin-antitoxin system HicB family antitoxin [Chlorobiota bacterium]